METISFSQALINITNKQNESWFGGLMDAASKSHLVVGNLFTLSRYTRNPSLVIIDVLQEHCRNYVPSGCRIISDEFPHSGTWMCRMNHIYRRMQNFIEVRRICTRWEEEWQQLKVRSLEWNCNTETAKTEYERICAYAKQICRIICRGSSLKL